MKAFPKTDKKKLEASDRRSAAQFAEAIERKLFLPNMANAEMFVEFFREELLPGMVAKLFRDGHIDFFHRDHVYTTVEIVTTDDGAVLTVPTHFQMSELIELIDGLYKKKSKPEKPTE
jgi:hypothetical protein